MSFSLKITTAEDRVQMARDAALADLAQHRWDACKAGVSLPGGMQVAGDDNTRLSLTGAVNALDKGMMTAPVMWKAPGGFVALSQAELEAAAAAIVQHIQRCFDAEAQVAAQIADASDPAGIDVAAAFASELEAE